MDIAILGLLSKLTSLFLPVSILFLVIGMVLDILRKRFYWSKYALILLVVTIVLLIVQISWTYQTTNEIVNTP